LGTGDLLDVLLQRGELPLRDVLLVLLLTVVQHGQGLGIGSWVQECPR
jgi:hypothetical protein